jgi:hypothetical protein
VAVFAAIPEDPVRRIPALRNALQDATDVLVRHFLFAQFEFVLYRSRAAHAALLDEYDDVCRRHDAEMDTIRPVLVRRLGGVPLLDTYRQAAIRWAKVNDHAAALRWAERGLSLYGDEACRPEDPADLARRRAQALRKLGRSDPVGDTTSGALETLVCRSCRHTFDRAVTRGRKPVECPECRSRPRDRVPDDVAADDVTRQAAPAVAPAWFPDPNVPGALRWWDGTAWTHHVAVPVASR